MPDLEPMRRESWKPFIERRPNMEPAVTMCSFAAFLAFYWSGVRNCW